MYSASSISLWRLALNASRKHSVFEVPVFSLVTSILDDVRFSCRKGG